MKKVVINRCFGGFSLSPIAVKTIAQRQGKKCYFFENTLSTGKEQYIPVVMPKNGLFWSAFTVKNPNKVLAYKKPWHEMSMDERAEHNSLYESINLESRPENREDPIIVSVVEELGDKANGDCAKLSVVEIPDDVEYEIDEYDGLEHIAEKHKTWS